MIKTQSITLEQIYAPAKPQLAEFQDILRGELASRDPLIQKMHEHILKMTGKFLRPALVILCAGLKRSKRMHAAASVAAAIELIHTATLIHDDIIDNSDMRRNQPSVHSKWGRDLSIVSGDYLYAKAFMRLASLKDVYLNQALAMCAHVMCEGEMKQIEKRADFHMSEKEYLKIIHQKTAALFQASCMAGAYLAGLDKSTILKLGEYGYNLGMAFQIVDDCLDLLSDEKTLGKTAGLDVYKNDVSLPLLYLFQNLPSAQAGSLAARLKTDANADLMKDIKKQAMQTGAIERAMKKADEYAGRARACLHKLPDSLSKGSLEMLSYFCVDRDR